MKIAVDGFEFDFQDAIDAFVFDEKDRSSPFSVISVVKASKKLALRRYDP